MADYTDEAQLKLVFGTKNIDKWADLDNDQNPVTISARVAWACETATEYMNSRLVMGKYEVPFSTPPKIIVLMTTLLAGLLIFDGRLIVSSQPPFDQMSRQRKDFNRYIRQLLSGQLKLVDATSGEYIEPNCNTAPSVADVGSSDHPVVFGVCSSCLCHTCVCGSLAFPCW